MSKKRADRQITCEREEEEEDGLEPEARENTVTERRVQRGSGGGEGCHKGYGCQPMVPRAVRTMTT